MIGVLAIMAILAAVIAPNALRTLDRAAIRAEADTLHNLGEQVKLYLRDKGIEPTAANWDSVLATYASLSPTDLLYNRRQATNGPITRLYVPDPVASNERALFLSSMRTGVALPSLANISANFASIWNTTDGNVPVAAGWNAWDASNIEFLVIERVNLATNYQTDVQTEAETLHTLDAQIKLYVGDSSSLPTTANWIQVLTTYASLSPTDLLYNRCQTKPATPNDPALTNPIVANQQGYITRLYVPDPAATNKRAMLISSMRTGVALPSLNNISTYFNTIWNTPAGSVPVATGWNSWNANNIQFLVIERVNLQSELQDLPIHLTNTGATANFRLTTANGTNLQSGPVTSTTPANPTGHPNQWLYLYRIDGITIDSSYVLSTRGVNFEFNGATWTQKP